jgi:uncharacterized protein (DUF433 family)
MEATSYQHVVLDDEDVPRIKGTKTKIVELAAEHLAHGYSPEEVCLQHPYLSLGQVHSAMSYYWDHEDEINADLERRRKKVEALKASTPTPPIVEKLRALKRSQAEAA